MVTTFCDLGLDFLNSGGETTGDPLTGPGGLMATLIGGGFNGANAVLLTPGDTLKLKGTGNLAKLVVIDMNGTAPGGDWVVGDTITNFDEGTWQGKFVYLGQGVHYPTDTCVIQLDNSPDYVIGDIDLAGGIRNDTQDIDYDINLTSRTLEGITPKNSAMTGSTADGFVFFQGVDTNWDAHTLFNDSVLDGETTSPVWTQGVVEGLRFEGIKFTRSSGAGFDLASGVMTASHFANCRFTLNTTYGLTGNAFGSLLYCSFLQCGYTGNTDMPVFWPGQDCQYLACDLDSTATYAVRRGNVGTCFAHCTINFTGTTGFGDCQGVIGLHNTINGGGSGTGVTHQSASIPNVFAMSRFTNMDDGFVGAATTFYHKFLNNFFFDATGELIDGTTEALEVDTVNGTVGNGDGYVGDPNFGLSLGGEGTNIELKINDDTSVWVELGAQLKDFGLIPGSNKRANKQ